MNEWKKQMYGSIIQTKTVFVSIGGKCFEYKINSHNNILETTEPVYLQGQHEEADPLIAFHVKAVTDNVLVRYTGTDVLVILLGLVGRSEGIEVIMYYGSSNNSRYIDVSHIACVFNEKQPGFTDALIVLHLCANMLWLHLMLFPNRKDEAFCFTGDADRCRPSQRLMITHIWRGGCSSSYVFFIFIVRLQHNRYQRSKI